MSKGPTVAWTSSAEDCDDRSAERLANQYLSGYSDGEETDAMVGEVEILRQRHVTYLAVSIEQTQYLPLRSYSIEPRTG